MSTFDYHEARASAGSSAQRNDCHPTTSPDHSYQSLQSCSSSVSSASSQSVIAHAQVRLAVPPIQALVQPVTYVRDRLFNWYGSVCRSFFATAIKMECATSYSCRLLKPKGWFPARLGELCISTVVGKHQFGASANCHSACLLAVADLSALVPSLFACCSTTSHSPSRSTNFTVTTMAIPDPGVGSCRGAAMLAVLQRIASSQQGPPCPGSPSPSPGTVPSGPAVALRQRHLQQLLYHHSQPRTAFQPQFSQQKPTPIAQAAAFGAWPQHSPVSATPPTAPQPCFSTRAFTQPPEAVPAVLPDQQACPRLDGSFLAECIKPPVPLPCVVNSCNQSIQSSSPLPLANQAVLSAGSAPAAAALPVLVKTEVQPSAAMVSPALTFSSLPSTTSCLSAAPNADIAPGDGPYDCFGTSCSLNDCRTSNVCCLRADSSIACRCNGKPVTSMHMLAPSHASCYHSMISLPHPCVGNVVKPSTNACLFFLPEHLYFGLHGG